MLPEVMEIWDVSEDRREWPLWHDKELRDLASVSISLQRHRLFKRGLQFMQKKLGSDYCTRA